MTNQLFLCIELELTWKNRKIFNTYQAKLFVMFFAYVALQTIKRSKWTFIANNTSIIQQCIKFLPNATIFETYTMLTISKKFIELKL